MTYQLNVIWGFNEFAEINFQAAIAAADISVEYIYFYIYVSWLVSRHYRTSCDIVMKHVPIKVISCK